jgi:hypothetical protein
MRKRSQKGVADTGSRTIRYDKDGVHIVGVVNVAGATSDGEAGTGRTRVSSRQRVRVVQRDGETVTSEEVETSEREESRARRTDRPGKEERG